MRIYYTTSNNCSRDSIAGMIDPPPTGEALAKMQNSCRLIYATTSSSAIQHTQALFQMIIVLTNASKQLTIIRSLQQPPPLRANHSYIIDRNACAAPHVVVGSPRSLGLRAPMYCVLARRRPDNEVVDSCCISILQSNPQVDPSLARSRHNRA